jgi:hypothetical protein
MINSLGHHLYLENQLNSIFNVNSISNSINIKMQYANSLPKHTSLLFIFTVMNYLNKTELQLYFENHI